MVMGRRVGSTNIKRKVVGREETEFKKIRYKTAEDGER